jgi:hypothetical protein
MRRTLRKAGLGATRPKPKTKPAKRRKRRAAKIAKEHGVMTLAEYLTAYPEAAEHSFCGEKADQGRIVVGRQYPNEGYAVVRCGNTEVQVGYSLLHKLLLRIDPESTNFADLCQLQKALRSITCEASQGRKGD